MNFNSNPSLPLPVSFIHCEGTATWRPSCESPSMLFVILTLLIRFIFFPTALHLFVFCTLNFYRILLFAFLLHNVGNVIVPSVLIFISLSFCFVFVVFALVSTTYVRIVPHCCFVYFDFALLDNIFIFLYFLKHLLALLAFTSYRVTPVYGILLRGISYFFISISN